MLVEFSYHAKHVLQLTLLYFLLSIHAWLAASSGIKIRLVIKWCLHRQSPPLNVLLNHPSELALNHALVLLIE